MKYPNTAGYKQTDTAKESATKIEPKAKVLREKVLLILTGRQMTADEIADALGETVLSIRPRVSELNKQEKIRDTGERRLNDSGHRAIVWELTPMQRGLF